MLGVQLGILMLGDSNDREVVSDYCQLCEKDTLPFDITLDDEGDRTESTCNMRVFGLGLNWYTPFSQLANPRTRI
jgi:hypothetical protein